MVPGGEHPVHASAIAVLENRCLPCHDRVELPGMVDLTTRQRAVATGAVNPGNPQASRVAAVVGAAAGAPVTMPPTGHALGAAEADALTAWLAAGAPWPERGLNATPGAEPRSR
jgi:hypothetical protein